MVRATGCVGSFFVQLATAAGAHVMAPARADDREYLDDLGATSCSSPTPTWVLRFASASRMASTRFSTSSALRLLRSGMTERDVRKDAIEPTR